MSVIMMFGVKGGSGKSTLAVNLAAALAAGDRNVLVLDTDTQATACDWYDRREDKRSGGILVLPTHPRAVSSAIQQAGIQGAGVAHVIVDTPGRASDALSEVFRAVDLVVIPVRATGMDLHAATVSIEICRLEGKEPVAVLSQTPHGSPGSVRDARAALEKMGCTTTGAEIGWRQAVVYAGAMGLGVSEYEPKGKSADEFRALAAELVR